MTGKRETLYTVWLVGYVGLVHSIDTLAAHRSTWVLDWAIFSWRLENGFDLFKFFAWFVLPLAFTWPTLDIGYFGFKRWTRPDGLILAGLAAAGLLAVLSIPFLPGLGAIYPGLGHLSPADKWAYLGGQLLWLASWLVGWEFLHRYALLTHLTSRWPRLSWLAIPVIEGVYHLQKPFVEAMAMVAFSLVVTPWALKRRNTLLPFVAHLIIEIELIVLMLVRY